MTAAATLVTLLLIGGLVLVNRDPRVRTSPALWLPVIWIAIATSRPVSTWLQMAPVRSEDFYLEGSPLDRNVFAALLAMGVVVLLARAHRVALLLRSNVPLLLFFAYGALSISWSEFPDITFKRWIKALGDLVMVLVVLSEFDPSAAIKRLFARVAFVFVPLSLLFIRYYGELGRLYSRWEGTVSYNGIATDKNMLGMACLVFGIALFWRLQQEFSTPVNTQQTRRISLNTGRVVLVPSTRSFLAHGLVLTMLVLLLVVSNSMTSLGCFVLASGLMLVVSFPAIARRRGLIHLLVFGTISVVFLTLFVDLGGLLLQQLGRNATLTGRTELWPALLKLDVNPWLGTGFESFWLGPRLQEIWSLYWWHPTQAHNGYLEIYLTLGWIGIGLLALVAIQGYANIIKMFSYDPVGAKLRLAYFVVAIAYNFTESAFKTLHPVWLAFLLAVIVPPKAAMRRAAEHQTKNQIRIKPKPARAFAGAHRPVARANL